MKWRDLPTIALGVLIAVATAVLAGKIVWVISPDWSGVAAALAFAGTVLWLDSRR